MTETKDYFNIINGSIDAPMAYFSNRFSEFQKMPKFWTCLRSRDAANENFRAYGVDIHSPSKKNKIENLFDLWSKWPCGPKRAELRWQGGGSDLKKMKFGLLYREFITDSCVFWKMQKIQGLFNISQKTSSGNRPKWHFRGSKMS